MLKLCGDAICEPLEMRFNKALIYVFFSSDWKKANIVPIHKKGDKQTWKIYCPVSLPPICDKIFEGLIFNEMLRFFVDNKLITMSQSIFKPDDFWINQLFSITDKIYKPIEYGLEVRSVFLDISTAFDKVWHEGVIFKLEQNAIPADLLKILRDFLSNRKQKLVFNGQVPTWTSVNAGVPRRSIFGPSLFLIYINDLSDNLSSKVKLFADGTSLFPVIHDINVSSGELNKDLKKIRNWVFQSKMIFNPGDSQQAQEVIFSGKIKKKYSSSTSFQQCYCV